QVLLVDAFRDHDLEGVLRVAKGVDPGPALHLAERLMLILSHDSHLHPGSVQTGRFVGAESGGARVSSRRAAWACLRPSSLRVSLPDPPRRAWVRLPEA